MMILKYYKSRPNSNVGTAFFMTSGKRAALVKTRSNLPKKMRSIFLYKSTRFCVKSF
jgi:hypothetical protein